MPTLLCRKSAYERANIEAHNQRLQVGSGEKSDENERCENDNDDKEANAISDITHVAF